MNTPATEPTLTVSADANATVLRYRDAYRVADTIDTIGRVIKVLGFVVGAIFAIVSVSIGGQSFGGGAFIFAGLAFGASFAIGCFVTGTLVSAAGQLNRAALDTAVNSSPFLNDDLKSRAMGLGTRPKVTLVVAAPNKA